MGSAVALIGAFAAIGPVAGASAAPSGTALLVANQGANSITLFAPGAFGNTAPAGVIAGSNTGLDGVGFAAFGPSDDVVALNTPDNNVEFFAPGASGNIAPAATLSGSNTGLNNPGALGYDGSGHLFVLNGGSPASITEYAAGASGNAAPIRTISGSNTQLNAVNGIGSILVLPTGAVLVANGGSNSVLAFAAGANGNVAPVAAIAGANTLLHGVSGVAVDAANHIYATNANNLVTEYAAGATGNATPIAAISGSNTGLNAPSDITIDPGTGDVIVSNFLGNTVTEYPGGSNGNVAPTATIAGAATGLNQPQSVVYTVAQPTQIGAVAVVQAIPGLSLLTATAQLTRANGTGIAGQSIVFTDSLNGVLCTATTNLNGVASCGFSLTNGLSSVLSLGYSATFLGNAQYLPSTGTGSLLGLLGLNLL